MTDYFDSREIVVGTIDELTTRVEQVRALGEANELRFYWRGQPSADWGVHSSLHRGSQRETD